MRPFLLWPGNEAVIVAAATTKCCNCMSCTVQHYSACMVYVRAGYCDLLNVGSNNSSGFLTNSLAMPVGVECPELPGNPAVPLNVLLTGVLLHQYFH